MAEPTLVQVFGAGASQTSTTLTITKADLVSVGLTVAADNTAESLLVAILLKAQQQLTQANQDSNVDQSVVISPGFLPTFVNRNNENYRQDTLTVAMDKPAGSTAIDPDDY
jgi:hypothetical protein